MKVSEGIDEVYALGAGMDGMGFISANHVQILHNNSLINVHTLKPSGHHEIEIWGDGQQTRSFCYVDDCVLGIHKLMCSDYRSPLNLGQVRIVTIDELADMVADAAGIKVTKNTFRVLKGYVAAIQTTPGCAKYCTGNLKSVSKKVCRVRMPGSRRRYANRLWSRSKVAAPIQ